MITQSQVCLCEADQELPFMTSWEGSNASSSSSAIAACSHVVDVVMTSALFGRSYVSFVMIQFFSRNGLLDLL